MTPLDEVLANPDDDTARLVYADQLESAGDPRGELIAVSCALAACADDDPRRRDLARRELALIRSLLPAWLEELGVKGAPAGLARGFPDYLDLWPNQLAAIADTLWKRVPLARMYLRGMSRTHVETLGGAAVTTLRELTLVDVGKIDYDAQATLAIVTSPWLSQLRSLDLISVPFEDEGFVAITGGSQLPRLERLGVHGFAKRAKLTRKGLGAAFADPAFRKLRELRFSQVPLKTAGARCFAKATCADKLETLALTACQLGAEGTRLVLDSTALPSLAKLSLRENRLGREPPVSIGPALAGTLRRLELSLNEIDDAWMLAFVAKRALALTHLGLRSNLLTVASVRALLESPHLAQLESLTISAQNPNVAPWGPALASIVELPGFARLRGFDADHADVGADGAAALARSPHARNLQRLALGFNYNFGVEGARALANSEQLANLECLELHYTKLADEGIELLCASQAFPRLRYLDLSGNKIGERGYAALARTTAFPSLRVLKLYEAKDPKHRDAIEQNLGALVDLGDFTSSMGRWLAEDELLVS